MGELKVNWGYDKLTAAAFHFGSPLSDAEKSSIIELYRVEGREKVLDFATRKKILPFVAVCLGRIALDVEFWDGIATWYRQRNEAVITCLDKVFRAFREAGVEKVFVTENFGALLAAGGDTALFASGDVDLYADPVERERIYSAFEQLGFSREERHSFRQLINTTFHNDTLLPDGFHLGVAWHPLSRMKLPCFVTADKFVDWVRLGYYHNSAIQLPDPEALAYICLLHISLHSFARAPDIRLYADISNVSQIQVDWDKVVYFAERDATVVRLTAACSLAEKLVGVDIPEAVRLRCALFGQKILRLLRLVYDSERNTLLYEPRGFKLLRIEAHCNDRGALAGLCTILFPERSWVRETYLGKKTSLVAGYIRHILNLFR